MKILIASTPATGHLNPLLSIAKILIDAGHEIVGLSSSVMRQHIEGIGAAFHPFPPEADFDLRAIDAVFPELKTMLPGPEMALFYMQRVFLDPILAQHEALRQVLGYFPAAVIIGDNFMFGTFPMLLGPRSERPAIALCGTMFLHLRRDDGAPNFAGLPPVACNQQAEDYANLFLAQDAALFEPARQHLNRLLARIGVNPLNMNIFDASVLLPDAFLQLTVEGFEYPRRQLPSSVHFIGTPPIVRDQVPPPDWAGELDGARKVILVTQGTFSNHNLGQLIVPTLKALAGEPDLLVVVTTGGRPTGTVPGPLPRNARVASYLPFEWLLPRVDALVTNGGYGTINQALSFGIPVIAAGLSEDKADVNARIRWAGVGIDLGTNEPTPVMLHQATREVVDNPRYKRRAMSIAGEFARIDTAAEVIRIIRQIASAPADIGLPVHKADRPSSDLATSRSAGPISQSNRL